MIPYFILLFFICAIAKFRAHFSKGHGVYFFLNFLVFISLSLFAGLRGGSVGTDTNGYLEAVKYYSINSISEVFYSASSVEIGYRIMHHFLLLITKESYIYLSFISAFILYFQLRALRLLSKDYFISLFIFICFGIYTFSFNGIRQAIAASILMLSYYYVIKGNFLKYLSMILLAFLFHKSVIVVVPFYFLIRIKFSFKLLILLFLFSFLLAISFNSLIQFSSIINERYATYLNYDFTGGVNLAIGYLFLSIFFIFVRKRIHKIYLTEYDIFTNCFLIGSIIFISVVVLGIYIEVTRLSFYFTLTQVFIWPIIFKSVEKKYKPTLSISVFLICLFYFYILINQIGNLTPYYLNKDF